jgi:hypothetical protein
MIITAARVDDARTSGGKTLPQLLLDRAQAHPERACMREKRHGVWVSYTWRDVIGRPLPGGKEWREARPQYRLER